MFRKIVALAAFFVLIAISAYSEEVIVLKSGDKVNIQTTIKPDDVFFRNAEGRIQELDCAVLEGSVIEFDGFEKTKVEKTGEEFMGCYFKVISSQKTEKSKNACVQGRIIILRIDMVQETIRKYKNKKERIPPEKKQTSKSANA